MERKFILLVFGFSLIFLIFGLAFFDFTIGGPGYHKSQIVNFQPNSKILYLHAWVNGLDPDGFIIVRDLAGATIKTDLKSKNLYRNQFMVLNGIFINARLLKVTEVEIQPLIPLKFFLAGLCLLFVIWKLYLSLEWTPQGLQLKTSFNKST